MSSIRLKQRTGSIKVKQRSGRIKLKQRTGRIEQTNRKIIHKNYFGPDKVGYVRKGDVEILHDFDGYGTVYKFDAAENSSYEDIFTGQFKTSDFPDYAGDGKFLRMEFWAKWNEIPTAIHSFAEVVIEPTPDSEKYQKYVYRSDATNHRDEYFRMFYNPESTALAFIADVKVYKVSPPEYVFA